MNVLSIEWQLPSRMVLPLILLVLTASIVEGDDHNYEGPPPEGNFISISSSAFIIKIEF